MLEMPTIDELRRRPGVKWRRHGPDVLAMWVADMDFAVAPAVTEAIEKVVAQGDFGYPSAEVRGAVAEGFAARMGRLHGWSISVDDVTVVQDVIQALQLILHLCFEPGAGIAIQTPIYHPFLTSLNETGHQLVDNPMIRTSDGWQLDVDGLRASAAAGDVDALLLCNPHNPLGRSFARDELQALADIATEFDLLVISDEIHAEILHPGAVHTPIASLGPEIASRTVTLSSASKAFNLAALKCAQMHTESPRVKEAFGRLAGHALGGLNVFGLTTTLAAWSHGDDWLDQMRSTITANRDLLAELVEKQLPDVVFVPPEATYLAWLDASALDLRGEAAAHFLEHAGVAGNSGPDFGVNGVGCVRLNFATSPEVIELAIERMANSLG